MLEKEIIYLGLFEFHFVVVVLFDGVLVAYVVVLLLQKLLERQQRRLCGIVGVGSGNHKQKTNKQKTISKKNE
jgi:hypothetical protein